MTLTPGQVHEFQERVWAHYATQYRPMPWRDNPEPYDVLVSELMLQQTQVSRVIPKFEAFLERFPDIASLAVAPLSEVLMLWSGLGYNRRAKFLHESAKQIMTLERFPSTKAELVALPGIGENTAAAILNYAFQTATPFVETNIRSVYIHEFFHDTQDVIDDRVIRDLVEQTQSGEDPRQWYYALMDYGTFLKSQRLVHNNRSKQYKKQPALHGSLRETRGAILKQLTAGPVAMLTLRHMIAMDDRFEAALKSLLADGLIEHEARIVRLTGYQETS